MRISASAVETAGAGSNLAGTLKWKERAETWFPSASYANRWNNRYAGKPAGCLAPDGYVLVRIFGNRYQSHRLIWLMETGDWPIGEIDHINGIRSDNRMANLRDVSRSQNHRNQKLSVKNTSGFMGVSLCKNSGKWRAYTRSHGRARHIGYYSTAAEAHAAFAEVAIKAGFTDRHIYGSGSG